ncbi:MAG TPA: flagellar hook-associated protein FlgL, partial [Micrococcaceae bacterium]
MINRVTSQTMMAAAQRNLQTSAGLLAQRQEQATALKAITRPSDDPAGTANLLQVRAQQTATAQYSRNIDNGNVWLNTIDSSMTAATSILNKVRDVAVQGSNGSLNQAGRDALAAELGGLKAQLMDQANTKVMGRSVYAGNSDAATAFTTTPGIPATPGTPGVPGTPATPDTYTFNGDPSAVTRRIGTDATVRVDANGGDVFGGTNGNPSVFDVVDSVITALKTPGADVTGTIGAIDDRLKALITAHTDVGVRQGQLTTAEDANLQTKNTL